MFDYQGRPLEPACVNACVLRNETSCGWHPWSSACTYSSGDDLEVAAITHELRTDVQCPEEYSEISDVLVCYSYIQLSNIVERAGMTPARCATSGGAGACDEKGIMRDQIRPLLTQRLFMIALKAYFASDRTLVSGEALSLSRDWLASDATYVFSLTVSAPSGQSHLVTHSLHTTATERSPRVILEALCDGCMYDERGDDGGSSL